MPQRLLDRIWHLHVHTAHLIHRTTQVLHLDCTKLNFRPTVEQLNKRVVQLARSLKVTRGRKLRVDRAVVETNIYHPIDRGILGAGVRVLSRLLRRAKALVGETPGLAQQM